MPVWYGYREQYTHYKGLGCPYTEFLENCVTVLQMESNEADALTVSSPSEIIANIGTSKKAATLMANILKYCKTKEESMAHLTKMMTVFIPKALEGEPTGGIDKD